MKINTKNNTTMNTAIKILIITWRMFGVLVVTHLLFSCVGTKATRDIPDRLLGRNTVELQARLERLVDRGNEDHLYRLGEVYFLQGKFPEAYDSYQRADVLGQLTDPKHRRNFVHSAKALGFSTPYDKDTRYFDRSMVFPVRINPFCGNSRNEDIVPYQWNEYLFVTSSRLQDGESYPVTGKPFLNVFAFVENCQVVSLPNILPQDLNSDLHDGPLGISRDGRLVFINRNYREPNKDNYQHLFIDYYVRYGPDRWSEALRFPHSTVDYSVQHPFFKDDEQALYFSSDKPGGFGGFDLYKSSWDGMLWGVPENLGPEINTVYDEVFPVFNLDGNLTYSSNHPETHGGLDFVLFKDGKRMLYPAPLNTVYDDFALTFSNATSGYLSSTRDRGAFADNIFRFSVYDPECKDYVVTVRDKATKKPIEGVIVRYNALEVSQKSQLVTTAGGRSVMFCHPQVLTWPVAFQAEKQGFDPLFVSQGFEYLPQEGIYLAILELEASVVKFPQFPDHLASGKIVVFFENDIPRPAPTIPSYDITYERYVAVRNDYLRGSINPRAEMERFFVEVDQGMSRLREFAAYIYDNIGNNRLDIFLRGHASPRSNPIYNAALSDRRNQSIRNYLMGWEGGKLARHFYEGRIRVDAIPFGDTQAAPGVSASFEDRARSVYSVEASRERRVTLFWTWKDGRFPQDPVLDRIHEQDEMRDRVGYVPSVTPREAVAPQVSRERVPAPVDPVAWDGVQETEPQVEKWFYVIVGSHSVLELAKRHASRLQSSGHPGAGIVSTSDGRHHRVYANRYPNMETAMGELGQYRTRISRDAWVHSQ